MQLRLSWRTLILVPLTHTLAKAAEILISGERAMQLFEKACQIGFSGIGLNQKGLHNKRFVHLVTVDRRALWSYWECSKSFFYIFRGFLFFGNWNLHFSPFNSKSPWRVSKKSSNAGFPSQAIGNLLRLCFPKCPHPVITKINRLNTIMYLIFTSLVKVRRYHATAG